MKEANAMATDSEKQARDLHAALSAHDVEKVLTFYADDIIFEQVTADGAVIRGKEEHRAFFKAIFGAFPDLKTDLISCIFSGGRAFYVWVMSGTHKGEFRGIPATGKSFSFQGTTVAEFKENKHSRLSLYFDSASFLRQLGILPTTSQK